MLSPMVRSIIKRQILRRSAHDLIARFAVEVDAISTASDAQPHFGLSAANRAWDNQLISVLGLVHDILRPYLLVQIASGEPGPVNGDARYAAAARYA